MRVAVALAVALAGCLGQVAAAEEPADTVPAHTLQGLVLSPALLPVSGADVVLDGARQVVSDDDGAFRFADVAPGGHVLDVRAAGFRAVSVAVEDLRSQVHVRLVADPASVPHVSQWAWQGFIECSTNYVAVCGALHDTLALTSDTYVMLFDTSDDLAHLQTEMVWQSTQELGDTFWLLHRYGTQAQHDMGLYQGSLAGRQGASPLVLATDITRYNDHHVGEDYEFIAAVFSGGAEETPLLGVTVGQEFQLFVFEFHNQAPPPGWTFT